jgi:hypothetical protein
MLPVPSATIKTTEFKSKDAEIGESTKIPTAIPTAIPQKATMSIVRDQTKKFLNESSTSSHYQNAIRIITVG